MDHQIRQFQLQFHPDNQHNTKHCICCTVLVKKKKKKKKKNHVPYSEKDQGSRPGTWHSSDLQEKTTNELVSPISPKFHL
jgi:hypothetical protein